MTRESKEKMARCVESFHLPRYQEIPTVGLYLEQVVQYISDYLSPVLSGGITASMVSNYVKKKLIDSPVKKQYSREQIGYLIFIAVAKNVANLEDIKKYIWLQQQIYSSQKAYDYFCDEFENVLPFVFGLKEELEEIGSTVSDEKTMLRSIVFAVAHKIYLEKYLEGIAAEREESQRKAGGESEES